MIGIVGLGLIGGSLGKAITKYTDHQVYGYDCKTSVMAQGQLVNAIKGELDNEKLSKCSILFIALYPEDLLAYMITLKGKLQEGTLIVDCTGVKAPYFDECCTIAKEEGCTFIGSHPMAGLEHAGLSYAREDLFQGASMILVPPKGTPIARVEALINLSKSIGFTHIEITTAKNHDRMIAFTSQLAHILSSAYVKSPTAKEHHGYSAGSYKDLTRVSTLNEEMWSQLFLANKDNLNYEITTLIKNLEAYRDALEKEDKDLLFRLLKEGRTEKEHIDGEIF